MNDRAEFYVPWVQNRGNVNQMFLGHLPALPHRQRRDGRTPATSPGADQPGPDQRLHRRGAERRPRLPHQRRSASPTAVTASTSAPTTASSQVSPNAVTSATPDLAPGRRRACCRTARSPSSRSTGRNWRDRLRGLRRLRCGDPEQPRPRLRAPPTAATTWTDITGNLPDVPVNSVVLDPSDPKHALRRHRRRPVRHRRRRAAPGSGSAPACPKVVGLAARLRRRANGVLAGRHARSRRVHAAPTRTPTPALVVSKADAARRSGPGSTSTTRSRCEHRQRRGDRASRCSDPLPAHTAFVSAGQGGTSQRRAVVRWNGLTVPAGGRQLTLTFSVRIDPTLPPSVTVDRRRRHRRSGPTSRRRRRRAARTHRRSPRPHAVARRAGVADRRRQGRAVGAVRRAPDQQRLPGRQLHRVRVPAPGATTVYDATCTTPLTTTPAVAAGASVPTSACKVAVPADAANDARTTRRSRPPRRPTRRCPASATLTTIAVAVDTLLVDDDNNAPDVAAIYQAALTRTERRTAPGISRPIPSCRCRT